MRYETIPTLSVWLKDSASLASTGRVAAMAAAINSGGTVSAPITARPLALKPIDDLIDLYEKAWSLMAKRNIVVDLHREIARYCQARPHVPMSMVALREVVTRVFNSLPSAGKYTNVICTGWAINCNYRASTGLVSRNTTKNPDYFAHSPDDRVDMLQKCTDMVAAVRSAKTAIAVKGLTDNDRTLKIFMAPEFYFRGVNGAYSPDIVADIMPRLRRDLGPGWENWLFVFGTAIASIVDEVTYCSTCGYGNSKILRERDPADRTKTIPKCDKQPALGPPHAVVVGNFGAEVQNVALVYHAGESYLVAKEYVSGIDYKNKKVRVEPGTVNERDLNTLPPQGSHQSRVKSVFNDERMGGCILNIAGLTVGLEVCLDHIASPVQNLGRASPYSGTIQILLIPSYGMEIGAGLYCRPGGVVFNVDGRGRGRSHLARKGNVAPTRERIAVNAGRGAIELWQPVPIPQ